MLWRTVSQCSVRGKSGTVKEKAISLGSHTENHCRRTDAQEVPSEGFKRKQKPPKAVLRLNPAFRRNHPNRQKPTAPCQLSW